MKRRVWEIKWQWSTSDEAKGLLADGWEPFSAVGRDYGADKIWFRRRVRR